MPGTQTQAKESAPKLNRALSRAQSVREEKEYKLPGQLKEGYQDVLTMKIKMLTTAKLQKELNLCQAKQLWWLAKHVGVSGHDLQQIQMAQSGGGAPHEKFVDNLLSLEYTIDEILAGLDTIENKRGAQKILQEIKDNQEYEFFCQLLPNEVSLLYQPLYENPTNPEDEEKGWKGLAAYFDMPESIEVFESTQTQGGQFNGAKEFFKILQNKAMKVGEVLNAFYTVSQIKDGPAMDNIMEMFEETINSKVDALAKKKK